MWSKAESSFFDSQHTPAQERDPSDNSTDAESCCISTYSRDNIDKNHRKMCVIIKEERWKTDTEIVEHIQPKTGTVHMLCKTILDIEKLIK